MTEQYKHDWMAWRHVDADRFLTDTIMFFKCRDCHKRMEVSEVERRLNENETLKADKRLLMHVVHGRAMASSLPKHLKEE